MKFELNENEEKAYNDFVKKLPKKYKSNIEITFTNGGGIGVGIIVKAGKYKKDITDYDCW